jgi:diadenosine tetraphosphate (Ap4A) HIT family hydrolase
MNATIRKFGHPGTLIAETAHWLVLLRPAQPTLGALVLAAKSEATAFADLEPAAFAELAGMTRAIEAALRAAVDYEKINYLMLMMVDPHVHFHVLPRYDGVRSACGVEVRDAGWPGQPALVEAVTLDEAQVAALAGWLRDVWPAD